MFDFFLDAGNYEERRVGKYDQDGLFVSTARCSDGMKPYETAVAHAEYNDGDMVIVENYNTCDEAEAGHSKWVETMKANPPDKLVDCQNAAVSQLLDEGSLVFPRVIDVKAA